MDFNLNEEQQAWRDKARKFATEEVAPISLARDMISDPRETFDWEIIKKRLPARFSAPPSCPRNAADTGLISSARRW